MTGLSRRVAASPLATPAAVLFRVRRAAGHLRREVRNVSRWVITSREHSNYTYELTTVNLQQLAWWVAAVANVPVHEARGYIHEIQNDEELFAHIEHFTRISPRWRLADREVRLHKRIGWYALLRALKPEHVVETGTEKGLGTVVIAAALRRNGRGHVTTIDTNPDSGYLIQGFYQPFVDRKIGDSLSVLRSMDESVGVFLHDSLHTPEHEAQEFNAVSPLLSETAVVLSDYAHASAALPNWAEQHGRSYLFFAERPQGHWFPGEGIGAAFARR